jgi:hypothetical protein
MNQFLLILTFRNGDMEFITIPDTKLTTIKNAIDFLNYDDYGRFNSDDWQYDECEVGSYSDFTLWETVRFNVKPLLNFEG